MAEQTVVVELYAGPGAGKSTLAAGLFAELKRRGELVELVREWVKSWAWEGRRIGGADQFYICAKQMRAEYPLYGKVRWVITDSPVALAEYYAERYATPAVVAGVRGMVHGFELLRGDEGVKTYRLFVHRDKPYVQAGRYETEEQARDVDAGQREWLMRSGRGSIGTRGDSPADVCDTLAAVRKETEGA